MNYETTKTKEQIQAEIDRAMDSKGKFRGMTYEEGVEAALDWILGHRDEPPMDD